MEGQICLIRVDSDRGDLVESDISVHGPRSHCCEDRKHPCVTHLRIIRWNLRRVEGRSFGGRGLESRQEQ